MASRHNFSSHLGVFWSSFIQSIYSVITLNKMHVSECSSRLYFRFKIKHTLFIILSCIFPVPYLLISEIGSNKIHALPIFILVLVYLCRGNIDYLTTVFVDTRLWKTTHPRKRFQNFLQSCVLSTDRIKIHQSQPLVRPSDLSRLSRLLETFPRVLLFSKVAYQRKRR